MRLVCILLFLVLPWSYYAFGQAEKVKAAEDNLQSQDYDHALTLIEEAVQHPKTRDNPKAWYTRMNVYGTLATNRPLSEDKLSRISEVLSSYDKVIALDNSDDNYFTRLAEVYLKNFTTQVLNKGVSAFQQGDYQQANDWFIKSQALAPQDTLAYFYGGINAQRLNRTDLMKTYYDKLIELDINSKFVYSMLITLENTESKNYERALEIARKAIEKHPTYNDFRKQEINTLILLGRQDEAKASLEIAISDEPGNANLLFNLGFLYENQKDYASAVKYYQASIDADPNYFEAIYNLGTYHYNQGVDLLKQLNELSVEEFRTSGEDLKEKVNSAFQEALPYFERSAELKPKEAILWNTLANIYGRLSMKEKESLATDKYKELTGN